jgi:endonuclease/exonuclease/phosphatase family metal-dependent hydrolase
MISKTDADGNPTIILGNFNFDLLSDTCNTRFKNLLATFNLVQLITVPTRAVSRSLLDHVYVSQKNNVSTIWNLTDTISDIYQSLLIGLHEVTSQIETNISTLITDH